jgi:type II secretory pathway pseudopilin PulG
MSFPLQLVIMIVTTIVSVALSVTGSTWTIKSDVRDMATRLELREDAYRQDRDAMTSQLKAQANRTEMLQIDVNDLKLAIAKMNRRPE